MIFKTTAEMDKTANEFMENHKVCRVESVSGGQFEYRITPTSIGESCKIKCNGCGKIKDITNYNNF